MAGNELPEITGTIEQDGSSTSGDTVRIEFATNTDEQPTIPTKRGRGRPRKTEQVNNQAQETVLNTDNLTVEQPAKKRGRPKKDSKVNKTDAKNLAQSIIFALETTTNIVTGVDTSLNEFEKGLIEPALTEMLSNLSDSSVERFTKFTNPVILVGGLVVWYMRIAPEIARKRNKTVEEPQPTYSNNLYGDYQA